MKPFKIAASNGKISAIYDNRYKENIDILTKIFNFGDCVYTKRDEDVTDLPKPLNNPHGQHVCEMTAYDIKENCVKLKNDELNTFTEISSNDVGLKITAHYKNSIYSKFAFNLSLNYISHKNGEWQNQFLVSSPYFDRQSGRLLCMFTRPDGNHLMLVTKSFSKAFSVVYSNIVHFFDGFEIIANSDRIYGDKPMDEAFIEAYLLPVSSYEEGLKKAEKILGVPYASYVKSDCVIGAEFSAKIGGKFDKIELTDPDGKVTALPENGNVKFKTDKYGFYKITPYLNGKPGIYCTVFSRYSWLEMYKKSIDSIPVEKENIIGHMKDSNPVFMPPHAEYRGDIDTNLCEHTMWAWAQLRYMQRYSVTPDEEENIKNVLNIIRADDESAYRERQTIIPVSQNEPKPMGAYNTYRSNRLQEAFGGANIMLDAWRVYKNEDMLEFAVSIVENLLADNLRDGLIIRDGQEDYTTVTALIFPIADLYAVLSARGDSRAAKFAEYCEQIGDAVVRRGLDFPTESTKSDLYNREYEDGSISCAALTALYVAKFVKYKPEYIEFAENVMKNHDAFSIYTYTAPMYTSSLRWWENLWEGDADGPAICCGHAWTIWMAEAEFWLGIMSKNSSRVLRSYNGYNSNFASQDKQGNMYAIYQCEPYISGRYMTSKEVDRRYAVGFPKKKDCTLSRYVYARSCDTWFKTAAIIGYTLLNCRCEKGVIVSEAPFFEMLYLDCSEEITVRADKPIEIFSSKDFAVLAGEKLSQTPYSVKIAPQNGIIRIK